MKKLIFLIVILALAAANAFAARIYPAGPRGGRTGTGRGVRYGRAAERQRPGGGHGHRRHRPLRAESAFGRV